MLKVVMTKAIEHKPGESYTSNSLTQNNVNSFEILPNGFLICKVKDESVRNTLVITPNQDQRVVAMNMNRWDKIEIVEQEG